MLRFSINDVLVVGSKVVGVKVMNLKDSDYIVFVFIVNIISLYLLIYRGSFKWMVIDVIFIISCVNWGF